jgi:hypothetical protein
MERGELIGSELEEVFAQANAMHKGGDKPFERKLFQLPRMFNEQTPAIGGGWPTEEQGIAAASEPAAHERPPHLPAF